MKNETSGPKYPKERQRKITHLMGPSNYPIGYFNMPKSACTTIKNILYYIQNGIWYSEPLAIHKNLKEDKLILRDVAFHEHRKNKSFDRPYSTFTFVRNPGLRVYSAFVEKIWATGTYSFPGVRTFMVKNHHYRLSPLEDNHHELLDVRVAFKQFLNFVALNLEGATKMPPNPHWASQYKRISRLSPNDHIGFIGRVETFVEDISFVLMKAGWQDLSIANQRFNEGPRPPFSLQDILDDEISNMLSKLYQNDYMAFDYKIFPTLPIPSKPE